MVRKGLPALSLLALAVRRPCQVLLPWTMIAYSLRTSAHILEAFMLTFQPKLDASTGGGNCATC